MQGFRLSFDSQLGEEQIEYTVECDDDHNEHISVVLHLVNGNYKAVALKKDGN